MSSLARRIEKRCLKKEGRWKPKEQLVIHTPDGGYLTLHPTNGWKKVSAARVRLFSSG